MRAMSRDDRWPICWWNGSGSLATSAIILAIFLQTPLVGQEVRGVVFDQHTGTPVENVLVRIDSLGSVTLTDADGAFLFRETRKGSYIFSFQAMGYETVVLEVEVPPPVPLEVPMPPKPIELPGFEVRVPTFREKFSDLQTQMDARLARLPGSSRVVEPERVRLYDTIHAKDPYRLLWRELRLGWSYGGATLRLNGRQVGPEVYIDDHRTWLLEFVLMPNPHICRVEWYRAPPPPRPFGPGTQLRAYTCLFMVEVAEGRRQMRETINWGDLIAGPGGQ